MTKRRQIPPEPRRAQWTGKIFAKLDGHMRPQPGAYELGLGHEDGCPTLATNDLKDCTCDKVTIVQRRIDPEAN